MSYKIFPITSKKMAKELKEESVIRYCSYLSITKKKLETGLTNEEINKFMPTVLGCSANSPDFLNKVDDYFADFVELIPYTGKELDTSLDASGLPVNMNNFICFKLASLDKSVAKVEDINEVDSASYSYALISTDKIKEVELNKFKKTQEATKAYITLLTRIEEKDTHVLKLILVRNRKVLNNSDIYTINNYSRVEVEQELHKLVTLKPSAIIEAYENLDAIKLKAFADLVIALDIVQVEGNDIYYQAEKVAALNTFDVVLKSNNEMMAKLKSRVLSLDNTKNLLKATQENVG